MPVCVCITSKIRVMIMSMHRMYSLSVLGGATLRRKDRFPRRFRISGCEFAFHLAKSDSTPKFQALLGAKCPCYCHAHPRD